MTGNHDLKTEYDFRIMTIISVSCGCITNPKLNGFKSYGIEICEWLVISLTRTGPTRLRLHYGQLTDPELMKNYIICWPDGGQVVGRGTGFLHGWLEFILMWFSKSAGKSKVRDREHSSLGHSYC